MPVKIIGLGPGAPDYILPIATKEMKSTDVIIGFKRAIESLDYIDVPKKTIKSLKELLKYIVDNPNQTVGVVASGDPCFYGVLEYIKKNIDGTINVIPGISSFQYLMSKLQKSWHEAHVGSLHGRKADFGRLVKEYPVSVWLTDTVQNPSYICKRLLESTDSYWVYVGENLSYPDEKITRGNPKELINNSWSDLCVVVVEQRLKL